MGKFSTYSFILIIFLLLIYTIYYLHKETSNIKIENPDNDKIISNIEQHINIVKISIDEILDKIKQYKKKVEDMKIAVENANIDNNNFQKDIITRSNEIKGLTLDIKELQNIIDEYEV